VRDDLAGDQPVKEMPDRREPLLDGGRRVGPRLQLDPDRDVQRLHGGNRRHAGVAAPGEEVAGRACVRASRVRIADR
jgi:hypothetical protein